MFSHRENTKMSCPRMYFLLIFFQICFGISAQDFILEKDILAKLNTSADPCKNFYEYACGKFADYVKLPEGESTYNSFVQADKTFRQDLKVILQEATKKADAKSSQMVKDHYKSCMDVNAIEALSWRPLTKFMSDYGGWPVVEGSRWKPNNYDWLQTAAKAFREMGLAKSGLYDTGIHRIVKFTVAADLKNASRRLLVIDQPDFALFNRDYYLDPSNAKYLEAYRNFVIATALQLGANVSTVKDEIDKVVEFETHLANISVKDSERTDKLKLYNPMTVAELKRSFPEIKFDSWFASMRQAGWSIDDKQLVDVNGAPYLKELAKILAKTDPRTLANYQISAVVLPMIFYLAPSLRENLRYYRSVVYGVSQFQPRWEECALDTRDNFNWPISAIYVKNYFNASTKNEVETMITYMRNAMEERINSTSWMDGETKARALEKMRKMIQKVAYPDYIYNDTKILEDFGGVNIKNKLHFENFLAVSKTKFNEAKRMLNGKNDKREWQQGPVTPGAFYVAEQNSIFFSAVVLQIPFYIAGAPNYINFARIGSGIGHEITHGFDDQGKQFDGDGNLANWWTNDTMDKYNNKTKCLIKQYSDILDEKTGLHLNGELEIGENIADNGGLRNGYAAYHKWLNEQKAPEKQLPGLGQYTADQLFFISFGQGRCSIESLEARKRTILTDFHALFDYRVNVPLQNFPTFSEAFNCSKGSPMNPVEQCSVW